MQKIYLIFGIFSERERFNIGNLDKKSQSKSNLLEHLARFSIHMKSYVISIGISV